MRRIVLVNPPNHRQDLYNLAPPLGLMVLAERATAAGWNPIILDLNLPKFHSLSDQPEEFYETIPDEIAAYNPNMVGFTSMGHNAHVALQLASKIKTFSKDIEIVTGGPFFSALRSNLKSIEPSIDHVVSGEGENTFFNLLKGQESTRRLSDVSLQHPFSAYELLDLSQYFNANPRKVINYESGRGCIFRCGFCYSPAHYSGVKALSPTQLKDDFKRLVELGAGQVFVVNDNFINDPKHALAQCQALGENDLGLTWNCYATLPQLTPKLVKGFAQAGCNSIYFGVDAVSLDQQRLYKKKFLRSLEDLLAKIQMLLKLGISPTCAFIFDLFSANRADIAAAIQTAIYCAVAGAKIRFNALARYAGTALAIGLRNPRYSEARSRIMLDCARVVIENPFAKQLPQHFPFHAHECESEETWDRNLKMLRSAQRLIQSYPEYFFNLKLPSEDLVEVFYDLSRERLDFQFNTSQQIFY